jgi:DNA-binding transcriptional MerR regulator
MDELADLTSLQALRADLDRRELDLIDRARHTGATWAEIAAALGLTSRQAAEQRCQRLRTAARSRRHDHDLAYAKSIVGLRTAVLDLHRRIEADHGWDGRFVRAALARRTLAAAADATPGALFALAAQALTDLRAARPAGLPPALRAAVTTLQQALRAAAPR